MKQLGYVVLTMITTAILTIVVKDSTTASEILAEVQKWYNNNVALANTSGLFSGLAVFILAYMNQRSKEKEQAIKIDVSSVSSEFKELLPRVDAITEKMEILSNNEVELGRSIVILGEMFTIAFAGTKVSEQTKDYLLKKFAELQPQLQDIHQDTVALVEKVKEFVEVEVKPELKTAYDTLKASVQPKV